MLNIISGVIDTPTPPSPVSVEYLVVGGGGAGSYNIGAGGGAGGYRTNYGGTAVSAYKSTNYTVTVGAGGTGGRAEIRIWVFG